MHGPPFPKPTDTDDGRRLLSALARRGVRLSVEFHDTLDSTSRHAARLIEAGEGRPPLVIVAGEQVAGVGTRGRAWHSPGGNLTATFAFEMLGSAVPLSLIAGVAVREALAEVAPLASVTIKWPNDLLLDGRKVAGLLCERRGGADLIGVGVNVRLDRAAMPGDLAERVAALGESVASIDRWEMLAAVAWHLSDRRTAEPRDVLSAWRRHDALAGHRVEVQTPRALVSGACEGIDGSGRLLVRDGQARLHRIASGTIGGAGTPV